MSQPFCKLENQRNAAVFVLDILKNKEDILCFGNQLFDSISIISRWIISALQLLQSGRIQVQALDLLNEFIALQASSQTVVIPNLFTIFQRLSPDAAIAAIEIFKKFYFSENNNAKYFEQKLEIVENARCKKAIFSFQTLLRNYGLPRNSLYSNEEIGSDSPRVIRSKLKTLIRISRDDYEVEVMSRKFLGSLLGNPSSVWLDIFFELMNLLDDKISADFRSKIRALAWISTMHPKKTIQQAAKQQLFGEYFRFPTPVRI